ncbi:hypothetical protein P879_11353 [Paragonimus westermani]|uniref:Phosphomannomutase n=1 Tax=Paragonimus westermani TaxID=34504 RepID=A0A8T0D6F1_9TREM|nr:hypothetical protein P879_11353 [Paragonimus westermani]
MPANTVLLFDVDGTLTKPRNVITQDMLEQLLALQSRAAVAVVSGSDLPKLTTQLGGPSVISKLDHVFSENGLVVHEHGRQMYSTSIVDYVGEDLLQDFINYCLGYMSRLRLPRKRGTFVEFRKGLINICPIGRSCSQEERDEFDKFDQVHQIRKRFVDDMTANFGTTGLQFAIGGQISIDVYPKGWDKRYCLQFLQKYDVVHFFGDKTSEGGNDFEIFNDPRTIGHTVKSTEDTSVQLRQLFPDL